MVAETATDRARRASAQVGRRPAGWLRANLFSTWGNTLLTLIGLFITYEAVVAASSPGRILSATFTGADGSACTREGAGACWPFITAKFAQFMYGRYPDAERWRVDLVYVAGAGGPGAADDPARARQVLERRLRVRDLPGAGLLPAGGRHVRACRTSAPSCGAACW